MNKFGKQLFTNLRNNGIQVLKINLYDLAIELLHGGWGYAEEYPISRYVVDAQVLPIFEGVKPVLELKVIARSLLAG